MSTMKAMLTAVETSKRSWQEALKEIQLAMNCTAHRVTKVSPLELLIGKEARPMGMMPLIEEETIDRKSIRKTALQNIEKNAEYDKLRYDKSKAKLVAYKVGDHVLLKSEERHQTKLDPKFKGPFVIVEKLDGDRYTYVEIFDKQTNI